MKKDGRKNNGGAGRGAGRNRMPESEKKVPLNRWVPPKTLDLLKRLKKKTGKSQGVIIEEAVSYFSENFDILKKIEEHDE